MTHGGEVVFSAEGAAVDSDEEVEGEQSLQLRHAPVERVHHLF